MSAEQRCPICGALVAADAEWCGQCYAPLTAPEEPAPATPVDGPGKPPTEVPTHPSEEPEVEGSGTVVPIRPREGGPAWPCPVCGNRNPIELNQCVVCGTPFARLFQELERRAGVEPRDAAVWSLLCPGLGHWKAGRTMDGVARVILFAWTLGTLLVLLVSRFGKGGLGPTASLVVLYLVGSAVVYAESAADAYRVAAGDPPLVSSRVLLWASVALVLLSVLIGSIVVLPAARGG